MSGRVVWEGIQLGGALAFVFLMGYIPHLLGYEPHYIDPPSAREIVSPIYHTLVKQDREPYPYPIHVDEHIHWVYVANMQRYGEAQIADPYDPPAEGQNAFSSLRGAVHERGFHVVVASMQWITGVSFPAMLHYLPAAWFAFSAFALYAALRPHPAAPIAAAFVGFVPTTVRFLGPGFLVPIGFVLAWLPVILIVSRPALRRVSVAILLMVLTFWSFFIHLIGGFAGVALLMMVSAFGPATERRPRLLMVGVALLPLVWIAKAFTDDAKAELLREEFLPIDFGIFDALGPFLFLAWVIGILVMVASPPRLARAEILGASMMSLATLTLILAGVVLGWDAYATYARWHPPFFFLAAVPIAFLFDRAQNGLQELIGKVSRLGVPRRDMVKRGLSAILVVVVFSLASFQGVQEHSQTPYYRVMTDTDWEAFQFVSTNVGGEYEVFLTHPWRAPFLAALTGKEPRAVLYPGNPPVNDADYVTLVQGRSTLSYYILNDVSLVIGDHRPTPPEFVELGPNVYGLRSDIVEEISKLRGNEGGVED